MFYFERETNSLGTVFYNEKTFGCMSYEESTEWGINEDFHVLQLLAK